MSLNSNFRIHSYIDLRRFLRKTWNSKIKKQGLKMWLYWRKKRKKSFKKTENKLVTENGKQLLFLYCLIKSFKLKSRFLLWWLTQQSLRPKTLGCCNSECWVRRNVNRIQKNCKHSSTFWICLLNEICEKLGIPKSKNRV